MQPACRSPVQRGSTALREGRLRVSQLTVHGRGTSKRSGFYGCPREGPQTGLKKNSKFLTILEAGGLKSKCGQV